eukprot:GHVT01050737.1.p1 GENE.GHVT01050737.1~~GHVT01050737.1.p1  ORF type:complete len:268 (+),score=55.59 GHVT01050737.1:217-1020(+)
MSAASFSHASASLTGPAPAEEEPLSASGKRMAVGFKNSKGLSKLWPGLAVLFVGGGLVSVISSSSKPPLYAVGRPCKPAKGELGHFPNAPHGGGAAARSTQAALPPAFPLEAGASHADQVLAATTQLRRDFEECVHEIAASNLRPSARRLRQKLSCVLRPRCAKLIQSFLGIAAAAFVLLAAVFNVIPNEHRALSTGACLTTAGVAIFRALAVWRKTHQAAKLDEANANNWPTAQGGAISLTDHDGLPSIEESLPDKTHPISLHINY